MTSKHTKKTVAVVEDTDAVRRALIAVVESAGHQAIGFKDGQAFLTSGLEPKPDCILLDLEMDNIDGRQVLAYLREQPISAPVIVVSGTNDQALLSATATAPVAHILAKPVDAQDVLDVLTHVL